MINKKLVLGLSMFTLTCNITLNSLTPLTQAQAWAASTPKAIAAAGVDIRNKVPATNLSSALSQSSYLNTSVIPRVPVEQIAALSPLVIGDFAPVQAQALTPDQMSALNIQQLKSMGQDQVNSLSIAQIRGLTRDQRAALSLPF